MILSNSFNRQNPQQGFLFEPCERTTSSGVSVEAPWTVCVRDPLVNSFVPTTLSSDKLELGIIGNLGETGMWIHLNNHLRINWEPLGTDLTLVDWKMMSKMI